MNTTKIRWFFHFLGLSALALTFGVLLTGCNALTIPIGIGGIIGYFVGDSSDQGILGAIIGAGGAFILFIIIVRILGSADDRIVNKLKKRIAAGDKEAEKELIARGTSSKKKSISIVGALPNETIDHVIQIIVDTIARNGGAREFKNAVKTNKGGGSSSWTQRSESPNGDKIELKYLFDRSQNYHDLNDQAQFGDISSIEYNFHIKMLPDNVPAIADEAHREIKSYLKGIGVSLRRPYKGAEDE